MKARGGEAMEEMQLLLGSNTLRLPALQGIQPALMSGAQLSAEPHFLVKQTTN